jgi:hypothetical protein
VRLSRKPPTLRLETVLQMAHKQNVAL